MITFKGNAHKSILKKINEIEPVGSYEVLYCPKADSKILHKVAKETKTFYISKNALLKVKGSVKASIDNKIGLFLDTGLYDSKVTYTISMFSPCSMNDSIDMVLVKDNEAKPYKMLPAYKQNISEDIQDTIYEDEFEKEPTIKIDEHIIEENTNKIEVIGKIPTKEVPKVIEEIQKEAYSNPTSLSHSTDSNDELVNQTKLVTKENIKQFRETHKQVKHIESTKSKRAVRVTAKEMIQIANDNGDKSIIYIVIFDKSLDKEIAKVRDKGYEMFYIPKDNG